MPSGGQIVMQQNTWILTGWNLNVVILLMLDISIFYAITILLVGLSPSKNNTIKKYMWMYAENFIVNRQSGENKCQSYARLNKKYDIITVQPHRRNK